MVYNSLSYWIFRMSFFPNFLWKKLFHYFSDKESYEWCFDGVPEGGIVAVSNVGCMKHKETRELFMQGYNEMLTRIQPKEVLFFGHIFDDYKGPVHYIKYQLDKSEQGEE